MAFLSSFFACFSDSHKVACEGDGHMTSSSHPKPGKTQKGSEDKSKNKSEGAPIPMSYFPIGSGLSRLWIRPFHPESSVFTLKHGFAIQSDLLSGIDSFILLCVRIVSWCWCIVLRGEYKNWSVICSYWIYRVHLVSDCILLSLSVILAFLSAHSWGAQPKTIMKPL